MKYPFLLSNVLLTYGYDYKLEEVLYRKPCGFECEAQMYKCWRVSLADKPYKGLLARQKLQPFRLKEHESFKSSHKLNSIPRKHKFEIFITFNKSSLRTDDIFTQPSLAFRSKQLQIPSS